MRIRDRAKALLQSLLLPVLAVALLAAFTIATVTLSANDRAIVWAEGTPAQLDQMQHRVSSNAWFGHGRSRLASEANPVPTPCGANAREFSFGALGEFEAQAAREILELIASEAGARPCVTNLFIINELPDPAAQSWAQKAAAIVLGASVLPLAMVLFVYGALSGRLRPGLPALGGGSLASGLAWGVGAGVAASLVLALVHRWGAEETTQLASMTVANVGYPLAFTLMVAVPMMEEVAFRGWMIPLAERGLGSLPAALASSLLYAAASLPADAWSAAGYLSLGAVYAAVYLRTRSVLACIAANILASTTAFWLG